MMLLSTRSQVASCALLVLMLAGLPAGSAAHLLPPATKTVLGNPSPSLESDAFGRAVAAVGDLDRDGYPDLAVGEPGSGHVSLYRGSTLTRIRTLEHPPLARGAACVPADPERSPCRFGAEVVPLGDLDGDGIPEIAVAAPGIAGDPGSLDGVALPAPTCLDLGDESCEDEEPEPASGVGSGGRVFLFGGVSGVPMGFIPAPPETLGFGWAMQPVGDVNGNGSPDLVIAAPHTGELFAHDGLDRSLLWRLRLPVEPGRLFLAGTGQSRVLVGAPDALPRADGRARGVVFVVTVGGTVVGRLVGSGGANRFGEAVAVIDDADGDGWDEYIIAEADGVGVFPEASRVHVYSGAAHSLVRSFVPRPEGGSCAAVVLARTADVDRDGREDFWYGCRYDSRDAYRSQLWLLDVDGHILGDLGAASPDGVPFLSEIAALGPASYRSGAELIAGAERGCTPDGSSCGGIATVVTFPTFPDFSAFGILFTPQPSTNCATVSAKIANLGTAPATAEAGFLLDGQQPIGSLRSVSLDAGEIATVSEELDISSLAGTHTLSFIVDPDDKVDESDEKNNREDATVQIKPDPNAPGCAK